MVEGDTGEPQAQGCEDHTGHPGCGEDFPHMGFVADGERVRGDSGVHCWQCNPGDEDDDGADPKVVDGDQERQAGEGVYGQGRLEECCEWEPVGELCGEGCAEQHAAAEAG